MRQKKKGRLRIAWYRLVPAEAMIASVGPDPNAIVVQGLDRGAVFDVAVRGDGALAVLQQGRVAVGATPDGLRPLDLDPSALGVDKVAWMGNVLALGGGGGLFTVSPMRGDASLCSVADEAVTVLSSDGCGRVWWAGSSVRCMHAHGEWVLPRTPKGTVLAVHLGGDGCVYVVRRPWGVWRYVPESGGGEVVGTFADDAVQDVMVRRDGTLYAALAGDDVMGGFGQPGIKMLLPNGGVEEIHLVRSAQAIVRSVDDRVLSLAGGSVWTVDRTQWRRERFPGDGGAPSRYRMRRGPLGALWICTPEGIVVRAPYSYPMSPPIEAEAGREVRAFDVLPEGMPHLDAGIVPVLHTGWADRRFDRREVGRLIEQLETLGHRPSAPLSRFARVVSMACPPEAFYLGVQALLLSTLNALDPVQRRLEGERILQLATAMADASGGVLGFGNRICNAERSLLDEMALALGLAPP